MNENEKIIMAVVRGAELLVEHGLGEWKIGLNSRRRALAETHHNKKMIKYSKHFIVVADKDQFDGVTLHEITHALLGPESNHGSDFVKLCKQISPNPDYARRSAEVGMYRYTLTCPKCGTEIKLLTRRKEGTCRKCLEERDEDVKFKIKENKLKVRIW